ncbi:MAG: hypothetical protein AAF798_01965 [Bacteroidota bacterium]
MNTAINEKTVNISRVEIDGEVFFKISNSDLMRPFFMNIISDANHWLFVSSNGGLTAGRKNAEYALFPYYTDDKITESAETTGCLSIFSVQKAGKTHLWQPFSIRQEGLYQISRNLYKSNFGNKVIFEEINEDLQLSFRYQWCSSNRFGFVRKAMLKNQGYEAVKISLLDGLQNILPIGLGSWLQNNYSNLADAYKKSELEKDTRLGIYALSAIINDTAEPSEALKANVAWSIGLESAKHLISSLQVNAFRRGQIAQEEVEVRAEKGAYLLQAEIDLSVGEEQSWMILADVNKNHAAIAQLSHTIRTTEQLATLVEQDIQAGTDRLIGLSGAADGIQLTADHRKDARHFSNTLFNIMRGGIFDFNYQIEKADFVPYLAKANKNTYAIAKEALATLPELFTLTELNEFAHQSDDPHFKRLCLEYLPLKFSRRHGDPSRPWNKFSINTQSEVDGSKILDYQGNWRDIFQNWEALSHAFPNFIEGMIHKFLNASTFDGYNPYRVTKDGFDWEAIEPEDERSYIGYWGDHQIIYLLKFLEFMQDRQPGQLAKDLGTDLFVYANVPYKIKSFESLIENSKETVDFDHNMHEQLQAAKAALGADAFLLKNQQREIHQVNFLEKMLATLLAKLSNFIPEGGIWLNTQRPEWNDANNALVGNGVSMVTLYYLHRFLQFLKGIIDESPMDEVPVSSELVDFFGKVHTTFKTHQYVLDGSFNDEQRMQVLRGVGEAGSAYRENVYAHGFRGSKSSLPLKEVRAFIDLSVQYLQHSIIANERADHLYHAYNLMTVESAQEVSISYLDEMLEGQVAVLSSGYLSPEAALKLLDGMKASRIFRSDQYSYILYPDKDLGRFLAKNNIPTTAIDNSALLQRLVKDGHKTIIEKAVDGRYHFNGNFRNANDLKAALDALAGTEYATLIQRDREQLLAIFEQVFNHKAFTGRSGTFFGYEGLGSIYWHMVSKLLLAVQEVCLQANEQAASPEVFGRLLEHYYEINEGIGVHKSPTLYGAFPTDAYSHTPAGRGAQQPGMTGQVKEDIISRFGELGVVVQHGQLGFHPTLLRKAEFLAAPATFNYKDIHGNDQQLSLAAQTLCFTYCQIPIVYQLATQEGTTIHYTNGEVKILPSTTLDQATSAAIFSRTGAVRAIEVQLQPENLK